MSNVENPTIKSQILFIKRPALQSREHTHVLRGSRGVRRWPNVPFDYIAARGGWFGSKAPEKRGNSALEERKSALLVELADVKRIRELIPHGATIIQNKIDELTEYDYFGNADVYHPLGQWTMITTPDMPAILYDDNAYYCTQVLTLDSEGRAIAFHEPLRSDHMPKKDSYFAALPGYIKGDDATCIVTGTNYTETRDQPLGRLNLIDGIVQEIERDIREVLPTAVIRTLISRFSSSQLYTDSLIPEGAKVRGFMFIPQYISKDGRNHHMVVLDGQAGAIRRELGFNTWWS